MDTRRISSGPVFRKSAGQYEGFSEGLKEALLRIPSFIHKQYATQDKENRVNLRDSLYGKEERLSEGLYDTAMYPDMVAKIRDAELSKAEKMRNENYAQGSMLGTSFGDIVSPIEWGLGAGIAGGASKFLKSRGLLDDAGKIILREDKSPEMFHGTSDNIPGFTTQGIPSYDLGTHFGNLNQATNRVVAHRDKLMSTGTNIHRSYLDDLDMKVAEMDDLGMWRADIIVDEIKRRKILDDDAVKDLQSKLDSLGSDEDSLSHTVIRNALKRSGYSTIKYKNTAEGKGLSFIALDPEKQISYPRSTTGITELDYVGDVAHGVREEKKYLLDEYLKTQGSGLIDKIPKKTLPPLSKEGKKKQADLLQQIFSEYGL